MTSRDQKNSNLEIQYNQQPALYMSQFILSAGENEVMLDCSSGVDALPSAGEQGGLPIHTRLALPWGTAERLANLLTQLISQKDEAIRKVSPPSTPTPTFAKLPTFQQNADV